MNMKKLLILLWLALLFVTSVFAQTTSNTKKYKFKGVIKNQDSDVIAGANLYFKTGEKKFTVVTDINGEFRTELVTGDYEITVNDVLSRSFKAFIKIRDEVANPNDVSFIVKTNKNPCGLAENEICPKPIKISKSIYPAAARAANITGEVNVKVKINKNGKVISAEAIGHPILRGSTIKAIQTTKFESFDEDKEMKFYMTYVFLHTMNEKKNIEKFTNLYRIESYSDLVVIDKCDHC